MIQTIIDYLRIVHQRNAWVARLGILLIALFFIMGIASFFDVRMVNGQNTWFKPMKFSFSIGIYLLTIIYLVWLLDCRDAVKKIFVNGIAIVLLLEFSLIFLQATRGVASHFNVSTLLDLSIFNLMGLLIGLNTIFILIITIMFFVSSSKPKQLSKLNLGLIRVALLLFIFSSAIGGRMVGYMSHAIGNEELSKAIFFLEWNTTGGDLRVAHFIGIHAPQVLPIMPFTLNKAFAGKERVVHYLSIALALVITVTVLGTFIQALRGNSFM